MLKQLAALQEKAISSDPQGPILVKHMQKNHLARILLICRSSAPYSSLIQALSADNVITICARFEGIEKQIEQQDFDLLIIEYVLKDKIVMRALELCKPATQRGAPVILLDGHPKNDFLAAAFAHGLRDYFPAPVQQDLLIERVNSLLKQTHFPSKAGIFVK